MSNRNQYSELGTLLQNAREALLLSQKQLADQLNLKEKVIAALDAGDFDSLPAPIYVKGYIRSYAQAVHLEPGPLVDLYENAGGASKTQPEIVPDVKPTTPGYDKESPTKIATYFMTFMLATAVIVWLQSDNTIKLTPPPEPPRSSMGGTATGGFTYTYPQITHTDPAAVNLVVTDIDVNPPEAAGDVALLLSLETLPGSIKQGVLEMVLTGESWIEVYDGYGKEQYFGLATAGETIRVIADPPLSVKFGNATAVSVRFNGELFDTANYIHGAIARFVLE